MLHEQSLTGLCAAVARVLGVEVPSTAEAAAPGLAEKWEEAMGGRADRVLMHNSDALAAWLVRKYPDWFAPVDAHAPIRMEFRAVMPSVTPVCFGTMYTGAQPCVHGIMKYEKPVIRIESLFDMAIKAGKKPVIVAVKGSSMAAIWLEKEMDYFIEEDDQAVLRRAMQLIEEDKYDLLAVYTADYDSVMHGNGVLAEASIEALHEQVAIFDMLSHAAKKRWQGRKFLLGLCTDHGVHDQAPGAGSHGLDIPDDLNIIHFFGAYGGEG